jgi:hypothetical protein
MDKRGTRIPEDRLRASLISGCIIVPGTVLAAGACGLKHGEMQVIYSAGLTMQFWTSAGGLALSLVWLFISG